jgi:hypothetical protein
MCAPVHRSKLKKSTNVTIVYPECGQKTTIKFANIDQHLPIFGRIVADFGEMLPNGDIVISPPPPSRI